MFELIQSGGVLMIPILFCSVLAMGIVCERFWTLRKKKIIPPELVSQVWRLAKAKKLDAITLKHLKDSSPLGAILATGLKSRSLGREVMKEAIAESGRQVAHRLERFLNTLGTIATITPLLGLLGTVVGMIKVFAAIVSHGVGDPAVLAGGISEALITTAAGLSVAIPCVIFHRYFDGLVDAYVLNMEEESLKLIEVIHGTHDELE
ncbi:biopolymer transport protein ExbB [Bathymodiolus japonicus methanotrophic gill symbiont]|uniref:MotA/TolQ/ExbB proton channel family protein n=1 Tax=Bathymodiolus japonicus methanotrophic gill symbiont TaxID=113269 RepID=UPI001B78013F|nr:MotA/TolQ/ExbB proton channel family protein [Bathymodiolus japonicus methanotrophic gill symbiont]GFO70969.1 biopolymer transport protein ExbB [Bathymodiolus japonicus methanotrophic gill symbiont]